MAVPITFVATGVRGASTRGGAAPPSPPVGRVKDSVQITAPRAGGGEGVRLEAEPGNDAVVIHIAGGPTLWLHPEHAKDLLDAQEGGARERGAGDTGGRGAVQVPASLGWRRDGTAPVRGATRGVVGDALVRAVEIVTGLGEERLAKLSAREIGSHFDNRVNPGLYRLTRERLDPLRLKTPTGLAAPDQPALVLIHGTFSDTSGTFGKMWVEHPALVNTLFDAYRNQVYGLDHPTLGVSPIGNAITLVEALPRGAHLHLLTHSRGGLVAEVLARVAAGAAGKPHLAGFEGDEREELQRLAGLVAQRKVHVDRIVRVACPTRGTLLASKRLDAYVSIVKWALEMAGVPIAPELVSFLGEVARQRANPDVLPGLAAQIPDSALIQWLHQSGPPLDGDLRVVAGDVQGDSVMSWVKTLLSDAFYWTDNDLVVQTRSMYGGMPRANKAMFVLAQNAAVSHFSYFGNAASAKTIVAALVEAQPADFRPIGPLSWEGTDASGVRAARLARGRSDAVDLPALFVLPGILGSNLRIGDDRIWLAWRLAGNFARLAYRAGRKDVAPDGPIGLFYDDLGTFLSEDHDVIPLAYDWRAPIEQSANDLADQVDAALKARAGSKRPVRILAHSMGGVVARTMQLERPDTFRRMLAADGARILMLGTPNGGSWAPMQVLSGDDTLGNVLTAVGAPFAGAETRRLIAAFPGLMQLQAGLRDGMDQSSTWQKLADADLAALRKRSVWHRLAIQLQAFEWGVPRQDVLDAATALRRKLDRQREVDLAAFAHKILLVVGRSAFTPGGYRLEGDGVVYLDVPEEGDGTVTLESALLPGVSTWTLDCEHGALPRRRAAFDAYRDLLNHGTTTRLAKLTAPRVARGARAADRVLSRSRPSRAFVTGPPPERETQVMAPAGSATVEAPPVASQAALEVTIVNGDLTFIAEPLLIGHYRSSKLTGAEAVIDRALGGVMSGALRRGLYPVETGSHQIFFNTQRNARNPFQLPRPAAVIVAGLGAEGELRGTGLVATVRQAVVAWSQRLLERPDAPPVFTLATTLLGSGGVGISAGQAAQLIAQGAREANQQLASGGEGGRWPQLGELRMVELYLDRATEAWRALQTLAASSPAFYSLAPRIEEGNGPIRRPPDGSYRGADYDFISAVVQSSNEGESIAYTVDTRRARSEVRAQSAQLALIRNLIETASNTYADDERVGRTLFSLLVPVDLEPFLASSVATVIEVEQGTAGIPWELLDSQVPGSGDPRPWAIRTKLLRKLRTTVAAARVHDASAADGVLVIGDPDCKRATYPKLPAARQEATDVVACFNSDRRTGAGGDGGPRATGLVGAIDLSGTDPDAGAVIKKVMGSDWRIIHIAAHGAPPIEENGRLNPRGIVLSNEAFLGPNEIASLRVVPELVFVNCCYLASGDPSRLITETLYDRAKFASGVAEALIQGGVRCVVAAGWAVDDAAAHTFAITFYRTLLGDATFSDAVTAARGEARKCGGTTWAAYQCYGDPDWTYRRTTADGQQPPSADPARELAGIASESALVLALDTMATRSEFQGEADQAQADRLRFLETTCAPSWRAHGRVAEAFGNAWAKILGLDEAIEWYERAQAAADGTASLKAVEELANLRARRAWEKLSAVETPTAADVDAARGEIESAMELLHRLLALGATPERQSLLGSAYKRLALVESRAGSGREPEARAALEKMKAHFEQAGRKDFYGAMNVIAAQVALAGLTPSDLDPDAAAIDAVRQMMGDTPPDFWSVVGQTEMTMYGAMAAGLLAEAQSVLAKEFTDHHQKVRAPKRWASVYDNGTLVLSAYARRKGGPESAAANEIRNLLKTLAQDPSSVRQAVQPILRAAPAADRPRRVRRRKKSVKR